MAKLAVHEESPASTGVSSKDLNEVTQFFSKAKKCVVGRGSDIVSISFAMIMREHVLLKGPPGEAKSRLAHVFLDGIDGAKIFKMQFSRYTSEDSVFGPPIFEEVKKGRIVRNIENSLVDANFAFLDEAMNASLELMLSMNEVMNERSYTKNAQQVKCPMFTSILTTNQKKERDSEWAPVYDRIFFVREVTALNAADSVKVLAGDFSNEFPRIDFDVMKRVIDGFVPANIGIPRECIEDLVPLLHEVVQQLGQRPYSTRSMQKVINLVKASAYLNGRSMVRAEDLDSLVLLAHEKADEDKVSLLLTPIKKKKYFIDDAKLKDVFNKLLSNKSMSDTQKVDLLKKLEEDAKSSGYNVLVQQIQVETAKIEASSQTGKGFQLGKGAKK